MLFLQTDYLIQSVLNTLTSVPVAILVGFFGLFLLYRWHKRYKYPFTQDCNAGLQNSYPYRRAMNSKFSKCNSPGCIRCRKYDDLLENLQEKLEDYAKNTPDLESRSSFSTSLQRMRDSISIEQLHQVGQSVPTFSPPENEDFDDPSVPNPTVFNLHGLTAKPWYERDEVFEDDIWLVEESFLTIWEEFSQVYEDFLEGNNQGWLNNNVPTGQWSVFHLYNQGVEVKSNCIRCPGTMHVLNCLKTFMSGIAFGNATFSVLQAGTHITPHYGPCNFRVRCHLGLQIPSMCTMTVAHQTRCWLEEGCILFDDSYIHEARHRGRERGGPRIVFLVDLWNPDVTTEEKEVLKHLFSV